MSKVRVKNKVAAKYGNQLTISTHPKNVRDYSKGGTDSLVAVINSSSFSEQKYIELLVATVPQVIESNSEYDRIEAIFQGLILKEDRSAEEDKLFDLLANLLEDYEKRTLSVLDDSAPVDILKMLMQTNDLKQADLVNIFGTQSVVSEVLNGKRQITKNQAKALSSRFSMKLEAFI